MSGSHPDAREGRLAEQHLGDRLAALVDGELSHEARERVLAHLATCARCKAEADAQRRLKSVFAEAPPPPPSESLLARLQGLPAGVGGPDGGSPLGAGPDPFPGRSGGVFGVRRPDRFAFDYVPSGPHSPAPAPAAGGGFRIHHVPRSEAERSASRGRRFAFAVGGAVSLAALALAGVTTAGAPADTDTRASGGNKVTPARTQSGGGSASVQETQRRRSVGPLLSNDASRFDAPVAPAEAAAPLTPGGVHPATVTTPVLAGAAAVSPLIRPLGAAPRLGLGASWTTTPALTPPSLLDSPLTGAGAVPTEAPGPTAPAGGSER